MNGGWDGILSLLIACIEIILLANLLIFAEKNYINKLAIVLISVLAVYQVIEFVICFFDLKTSFAAYLAFVDISFLPPLNLVLIINFLNADKKYNKLFFLPPLFFTVYYAIVLNNFEVVKCTVLYASYSYPLGTLYGIFYYLPILASILLLLKNIGNRKQRTIKAKSIILLTGLIAVSIPVITGFILLLFFNNAGLISVIESIMCKLAVVYAFCLSYFILINKASKYERNNS